MLIIQLFAYWIYIFNIVAHDFHTSLAQVYYNRNSQSFEITLRVFTDDLEAALTLENANKKVNLENAQQADPIITQYLNKHLRIINQQNQKKKINYVGKEIEVDVTWIYVEVPMTEQVDGIQIQNSILTEMFDDQVNIVNFKYLSTERTYLFKSNQTVQKINVNE